MALTFYWYPKCGTCKKAKTWLEEHHIACDPVHIVENPPSKKELLEMIDTSGLPARKFFNTSGKKYRELGMKDKVNDLTVEEIAEYLASDGMLIKRPIVFDGSHVTIGFNEKNFESTWLKQ